MLTGMDTSMAPLILVALVAGMAGTWMELRNSLKPQTCDQCPHCRAILVQQRQQAAAEERRQRALSSWYARRHGVDDGEDDDRTIG
jgi:hypothetical protein